MEKASPKNKEKKVTTIRLKSPLKQTNFLTEARQYLSPNVYRSIKFIVNRIMSEGLDLTPYIERQETLKLIIPITEIKKEYPTNQYDRDLKDAAQWLNATNVHYNTPNGWVFTHLIGEAHFDKKIGMTVYITPGALQLYHVRSEEFTLLDFKASMVIKSKAAAFFYDKCCMWRSRRKFEYIPDKLREDLNLSYPNSRLKQRIIIPAQEELEGLYNAGIIDVYFDCEEIKEGRGQGGEVKKWIFRVRTSSTADSTIEIMDRLTYQKDILSQLQNYLPANIQSISSQIEKFSTDRLLDLKERIDYFINKEIPANTIRDYRSYIFIFLKEEFGINPNLPSKKSQRGRPKKQQEKAMPDGGELFLPEQWKNMLAIIKASVNEAEYNVWFHPDTFQFKDFDGKSLIIIIPSLFYHEMLESKYLEVLKTAVHTAFGNSTQLSYVILDTIKKRKDAE